MPGSTWLGELLSGLAPEAVDVPHVIMSQLTVDALLVYAQVCAKTRELADERKRKVAAAMGLVGVPSAACIRQLCNPWPLEVAVVKEFRWLSTCRAGVLDPLQWTDQTGGAQYLLGWALEALDRLDSNQDLAVPNETNPGDAIPRIAMSSRITCHPSSHKAPLAALAAMLLHMSSTCRAVEAVIVKLLKETHASGVGCGKPRMLLHRHMIVRHVQKKVPPLHDIGQLHDDRLILRCIDLLVYREYACWAEKPDTECLYYLP